MKTVFKKLLILALGGLSMMAQASAQPNELTRDNAQI